MRRGGVVGWLALVLALPTWGAGVGPRVGVAVDGLATRPSLDLESAGLLDCAFASAPVDWEPHGGSWGVSNRYPCDTTWSFFGGQSLGLCSLWSKRRFTGDVVVEAYVGFKHAVTWAPEAWHCMPSDLNISLAEQPGDLSCGTSFIYSGVNGSSTLIRQGPKVLVCSFDPADVAPQFLDRDQVLQPDESGQELGLVERRWWRVEARRTHGRLALAVDGRTLVECVNPCANRPAQVVLWTIGSGMMLARVRVSYEGLEAPAGRPVRVHESPP